MVHNLIIYDKEEAYAKSFANYINTQKSFPFEVRYFCKLEDLNEYAKKTDIDIILMEEELMADISDLNCRLLIKLNGDKVGNVKNEGAIYKYQSCEQIKKQILMLVAESPEIKKLAIRKTEMIIIGCYSPIKVAGQTQLAIAIGQKLSSDFRVLYINLEGNSGLEELMNNKFAMDLSDLMYDLQNSKRDISATIGGNVHNLGGLDILPVMRDFRDLAGMTFSDWKNVLRKIETDTEYDFVILDISDSIQGICELLSICNKIFMTEREDTISNAKKRQFFDNLSSEYRESILEKIKECKPPVTDEGICIFDRNSGMGDYAGDLLAEVGLV